MSLVTFPAAIVVCIVLPMRSSTTRCSPSALRKEGDTYACVAAIQNLGMPAEEDGHDNDLEGRCVDENTNPSWFDLVLPKMTRMPHANTRGPGPWNPVSLLDDIWVVDKRNHDKRTPRAPSSQALSNRSAPSVADTISSMASLSLSTAGPPKKR